MDADLLMRGLRSNWVLVVILVACVIVVAAHVLWNNGSEETAPAPEPTHAVVQPDQTEPGPTREDPRRRSIEEQTLDTIAEHQARIDAAPEADDVPALLMAMGNLYRRIGRYEEAVNYYETLLLDHPDWEGVRVVYDELATSYERMDDRANARRVYTRMLEVFPEDSAEYEYARAKLMGEI